MRLLFVCTGNTCRSPMAAAIAASLHPDGIDVDSAGTAAAVGDSASAMAREVARAHSLTLDDHRSKLLTRELAEAADCVVAMESSHAEKAKELGASGRIVCLDIADPAGGDAGVYAATWDELHACISELLPHFRREGATFS